MITSLILPHTSFKCVAPRDYRQTELWEND